jgi:signal transduction histidine kinase
LEQPLVRFTLNKYQTRTSNHNPLTKSFNIYNILFIFGNGLQVKVMIISKLMGRSVGSEFSLSTSDLIFYNTAPGSKRARGEDYLRTDLQSLLNQLVDKTKAQGGLLSYNGRGERQFLVAGDTDKEFEMSQNEHRLLLAGESFVKEGTYIQPVAGNGRLLGIICITINSRAWEPLCEDLASAYAQLAAQSFERNRKQDQLSKYARSLLEKKRELEQIQEYNQNLLSITAHDLSSPLNAVSGYLEMIDDYLGNEDHAHKLHYYYKRIQSGVNDVSEMLTQLNEVVKLKKGFSSLNSVNVEVNGIIKEVCNLLSGHAEKKGSHLQVEMKGEPAYIKADVVKFKRVIYNLVSNAIKYSQKYQPIRVRTEAKNGQIYINIRDSGAGILKEDMDTIFDPFVKHNSNGNDAASYGLGLYISSYFTELMNGEIIAESKFGEGSTFTVVMPLVTASATQSRTA